MEYEYALKIITAHALCSTDNDCPCPICPMYSEDDDRCSQDITKEELAEAAYCVAGFNEYGVRKE